MEKSERRIFLSNTCWATAAKVLPFTKTFLNHVSLIDICTNWHKYAVAPYLLGYADRQGT